VSLKINDGGSRWWFFTANEENSRFSMVVSRSSLDVWREVAGGRRCPYIDGSRRFVAGGEDKLESTAAYCALVHSHSGLDDLL
jgi:hypothetical protein